MSYSFQQSVIRCEMYVFVSCYCNIDVDIRWLVCSGDWMVIWLLLP